jgi:1-deoxy-D-xylulose-5-phosphate reductoisomerase
MEDGLLNGNGRKEPGRCKARRRISILGATGSIGESTCHLIRSDLETYDVVALTAHRNVEKLAQAAIALQARFAAVADPMLGDELRQRLDGTGIASGAGRQALIDAASMPADWIMASIIGAAGLEPTFAAIQQGCYVALANKECLVSAGHVFMAEVARHRTTLIPVDSEHSAVFQALDDPHCEHVERIVLTASGGPFRSWSYAQLKTVRPEDALKHPNWSMGQKITIDSATLMNKGLEIIEAYHLFKVGPSQLSAIVHPQSIIHCLIYYRDGSVLAQASLPDMRTPIAYSLSWPGRMAVDMPRLDLARQRELTFEEPDEMRFPCLRFAREALAAGGSAPTVLNAANEVAVEAFLARRIGFLDIAAVVADTLEVAARNGRTHEAATLADVLETDAEARVIAQGIISRDRTLHPAAGHQLAAG